MIELLGFISNLLSIYVFVLIASAVFSWLYAFGVINARNQAVTMIGQFLYVVTEPVLRPIRRILPNMGGIDLSPVVVVLIIMLIQQVILPNIAKLFY